MRLFRNAEFTSSERHRGDSSSPPPSLYEFSMNKSLSSLLESSSHSSSEGSDNKTDVNVTALMQQGSYFPTETGSSKLPAFRIFKLLCSDKLLTNQVPLSHSSKYFTKKYFILTETQIIFMRNVLHTWAC